jgi:RNA polymerase sigma-70 factor (ECF subfamily)
VERPERFEGLFHDVAPSLWRAIFVYTAGEREIADDAVAEAFARSMAHADSVRSFEPWLYRTAFRIAAAELRRRAMQLPEQDRAIELADPSIEDLVNALRKLSPSQRAAIVLHYEADLPVAEVARRMGSTAGAVRVHLHTGRKRLRALLPEDEGEE